MMVVVAAGRNTTIWEDLASQCVPALDRTSSRNSDLNQRPYVQGFRVAVVNLFGLSLASCAGRARGNGLRLRNQGWFRFSFHVCVKLVITQRPAA